MSARSELNDPGEKPKRWATAEEVQRAPVIADADAARKAAEIARERHRAGLADTVVPADFRGIDERTLGYMSDMGMEPTPDAARQLENSFVPALRIMCQRGYNPRGVTWKEGGWMSLVWELYKKIRRIHFKCWLRGQQDYDSALDIINYAGMLHRAHDEQVTAWGILGPPSPDADRSDPEPDPLFD